MKASLKKEGKKALCYDKDLERRDEWKFPPVVPGATYSHYTIRVPNRKKVVDEFSKRNSIGRIDQLLNSRFRRVQIAGLQM